MTLRQLFDDAVKYDEPKLAYSIYWASLNGLSMDQDFETLKSMQIDWQTVNGLIASNPLGIGQIKLYTCKDGDGFHLVLAKDDKEAKGEILTRYGYVPKQMHDVSHGMDKALWDDRKRKSIWIRGVKDAALEFPVYIGMTEKE